MIERNKRENPRFNNVPFVRFSFWMFTGPNNNQIEYTVYVYMVVDIVGWLKIQIGSNTYNLFISYFGW